MRTVVFSDVHGNLPALEAMLAHAGTADQYLCLGDVVNYGPWSDECAQRVAALPACRRLMGNHDQAFLEGSYTGSHPVARAFFDFCYPRFHRRHLLENYEAGCAVGGFWAQHTLNNQYIFADTPLELDRSYLIGHSHYQFARDETGHRLVNVGSVGQNRRNLGLCQYAVHESGSDVVTLRTCPYDAEGVIAEMRALGYPHVCVEYYVSKLR